MWICKTIVQEVGCVTEKIFLNNEFPTFASRPDFDDVLSRHATASNKSSNSRFMVMAYTRHVSNLCRSIFLTFNHIIDGGARQSGGNNQNSVNFKENF